jgi:hypothetical protein
MTVGGTHSACRHKNEARIVFLAGVEGTAVHQGLVAPHRYTAQGNRGSQCDLANGYVPVNTLGLQNLFSRKISPHSGMTR